MVHDEPTMSLERVLVHIPHSSDHVPSTKGYTDLALARREIERLTDWHTERLFALEGAAHIRAPFSRVFCDVERFVPDELEPMAAKGMGFYYTHSDDGLPFRDEGPWKATVKELCYDIHHRAFQRLVNAILDRHGSCIILDAHSFTHMPFKRDLDQTPDRPDICIGTDSFHSPEALVAAVEEVYRSAGLSVKRNSPYAGTIVPLNYYHKDARVSSIMIEINRRLYMEGTRAREDAVKELRELSARAVGAGLRAYSGCFKH